MLTEAAIAALARIVRNTPKLEAASPPELTALEDAIAIDLRQRRCPMNCFN
ncbi:MAG: hypothetical protein HC771_22355 [Synechococcales cyanobacterium CRU_2_2]|nr:hypothetical protein [Synechococcales cyanobacterium CRU_2_2]